MRKFRCKLAVASVRSGGGGGCDIRLKRGMTATAVPILRPVDEVIGSRGCHRPMNRRTNARRTKEYLTMNGANVNNPNTGIVDSSNPSTVRVKFRISIRNDTKIRDLVRIWISKGFVVRKPERANTINNPMVG